MLVLASHLSLSESFCLPGDKKRETGRNLGERRGGILQIVAHCSRAGMRRDSLRLGFKLSVLTRSMNAAGRG